MKELSFHERQFLQRLFRQQGSIKYSFDEFVRRVGPLLAKWSDHGGDRVWIGNATIERQIERLLDDLHTQLVSNISNTVTDVWNLGNRKADELVTGYIKDMAISTTLREKLFSRNADALNTLLKRKDEFGKTISSRVWDITDGAMDNLEYYLSSGLSSGRPSALISQDIRQLLNEPNRRFRRVRDANGKLVLSQPMKDYHPGQGVYRSSYKNALRLAATETNKAFRTADYERWQKMDFVTGYEVERSPSNHGPCPVCLLNGSFSHKDFPVRVKMTGKSIKEFLNQPHKFKKEKNELIKNIGAIFAGSDYKGYTEYHKDNPMIKYSHVFEIELNGEKSWIIVREDITCLLYTSPSPRD